MALLLEKLISAGQQVAWWLTQPLELVARQTVALRELTLEAVTLRLILAMLLSNNPTLKSLWKKLIPGRKGKTAGEEEMRA